MIVYGGFRYLLGSSMGDVAAGKTIVLDAIIGLLLTLGAYTILNTINPNTLEMPEIKLGYINPSLYGEGEGMAEPIRVGGGQSCRCSRIPQGINESSVLKVPCYRQYDSAWGALPYGANLLPAGETMQCDHSYSPTLTACARGTQDQDHSCMKTLGEGGCGPASLAVVMGYYGVQVNGHLITPADTAAYAVRSCLRPQNGGTTSMCSPRFSEQYPGFTCSGQGGGAKATTAAQEIRAGHPVIFHCGHCNVTKQNGEIASGSVGDGHYMVLTGVNETGTIFSVHDVGHEGGTAAIAISGEEVNSGRVGIYLIRPRTQVAVPGAAGRCTGTGTSTASLGSVRGNVTFKTFTYCHGGEARCAPSDASPPRGWIANQAWVMIPQRLVGTHGATIRLYIFLHGHNTGHDPSHIRGVPHDNHVQMMLAALQRADPAKNIVIVGSHWMGGPTMTGPENARVPTGDPMFMGNFDAQEFYDAAVQKLRAELPGVIIRDVSVGGHSASVCASPGPLTKAFNAHLPGEYGFVMYDGCMGDVVRPASIYPRGKPLLINPDATGMGGDHDRVNITNRGWGLVPFQQGALTCPAYIPAGVQCFKHPTEAWWSFVTHYGHGPSVPPMTDLAFRALYGP